MHPRTFRTLDQRSLRRAGEAIETLVRTRQQVRKTPGYASPLPAEVGFQLTNRCNLRCEHCFQWNDTGFHRRLPVIQQRDDLDIGIIGAVLRATRSVKSKVYLWGGEPLVYRHWDRLIDLLESDPRWTVLCTNGIGMEHKLESLIRVSSNMVALISIDGPREVNDSIRGRGTFDRIMHSLDLLQDEQAKGAFRGEVSISAVLSPQLIHDLTGFVERFEARGVNTVFLVFPWYIPQGLADRMDAFFAERFAWLQQQHLASVSDTASWHSYRFHVGPELIDELKERMAEVMSRTWKIRVRFQPALAIDEVEDFIRGAERPAQGRTRCLSVATRLNVLPDGHITTCKLFPEFAVGQLTEDPQSMVDLWSGRNATRAREVFACGLMPICSKCVQLYLCGI